VRERISQLIVEVKSALMTVMLNTNEYMLSKNCTPTANLDTASEDPRLPH
jgi:hypothetical protein